MLANVKCNVLNVYSKWGSLGSRHKNDNAYKYNLTVSTIVKYAYNFACKRFYYLVWSCDQPSNLSLSASLFVIYQQRVTLNTYVVVVHKNNIYCISGRCEWFASWWSFYLIYIYSCYSLYFLDQCIWLVIYLLPRLSLYIFISLSLYNIYIYIYVHIQICIHIFVYTYMCTYVYMYEE